MTDLIDEVSQDLKEENNTKLVGKLIRTFAVFSALVIVGVSLYVWKENNTNKLQYQLGSWFSKAIEYSENNELDLSLEYLNKIIEHSHQQYAALAYLNKAAIMVKKDKIDEAKKVLLEMESHKHFSPVFRELAQLTYLSYELKNSNFEYKQASEILDKMTKENKAWRLSSLQLKALYDIKNNKTDDAKKSLKEILSSKQATRSNYDTASSILSSFSRTE